MQVIMVDLIYREGVNILMMVFNIFIKHQTYLQEIFEIVTYRGKKSRVEIKPGTCIVFKSNRANHGLETVTDPKKNDIIDKRDVLNLFPANVKLHTTSDAINIGNVNSNFCKSNTWISYYVRELNNNTKRGVIVSVNENIEMIIATVLQIYFFV